MPTKYSKTGESLMLWLKSIYWYIGKEWNINIKKPENKKEIMKYKSY